jgi:arylsulfatase A-like enzyme
MTTERNPSWRGDAGRILLAAASWGGILGALVGVVGAGLRLAPQGYIRTGLYRLWLWEASGHWGVMMLALAGAALAATILWGGLWWVTRTVSRWLKIDPRTPWGCGMLLLLGLVGWWIWWDARAFIGDILAITWAAEHWKSFLAYWNHPNGIARWMVGLVVVGPVIVSPLRLIGPRQHRLRWFDRGTRHRAVFWTAGVTAACVALVVFVLPLEQQRHARGRPSVVLITIDTLRADHLGCYGYPRNTSPHMDALAKGGIRFAFARAASNWTAPSMGTTLTGLFPSEHGASIIGRPLRRAPVTLAETLRNAGYNTHAIISHYFINRENQFDQGFATFDESPIVPYDESSSERVTRAALDWLADAPSAPYFLWVHYFDPHFTYLAHEDFRFESGYIGTLTDVIDYDEVKAIRNELTAGDLQHIRDIYDQEIAFTDDHVHRVLTALRDTGRWDDTLIVLHADHGEEFMERGDLAHHNKAYEELVHIPLIIAGAVDDALAGTAPQTSVSLRDIPGTVARFCGIATEQYGEGDLLATARGDHDANTAPVLVEGTDHSRFDQHMYALVDGAAKLIWTPHADCWEFYNIADDPDERINRFTRTDPAIATMESTLLSWADELAALRGDSGDTAVTDDAELRRLEGLGYTGGTSVAGTGPDADSSGVYICPPSIVAP